MSFSNFSSPRALPEDVGIQLPSISLGHVPLYLTLFGLAFLVGFVSEAVFKKDPLDGIPILGEERGDERWRRAQWLREARKLYIEGYEKVRIKCFLAGGMMVNEV